jgi:hypothetical protein
MSPTNKELCESVHVERRVHGIIDCAYVEPPAMQKLISRTLANTRWVVGNIRITAVPPWLFGMVPAREEG